MHGGLCAGLRGKPVSGPISCKRSEADARGASLPDGAGPARVRPVAAQREAGVAALS